MNFDTKESLKLQEIFLRLARMFTVHHDLLTVEANHAGDFVTLSPRAHSEDASKLVGSGGANFRALINVLNVAAARLGVRFYLARVKDVRGTEKPQRQPPFKADPNWPKDEIMALFRQTCADLFDQPFTTEWSHQSGDTSFIELELAAGERISLPDEQLADGLSIVFNAIGMSHHRKLRVSLERKGSPHEAIESHAARR